MVDPKVLNNTFNAFDKDGDGVLSSADVKLLINSVGIILKREEVESLSSGQAEYTREQCNAYVTKVAGSRDIRKELEAQLKAFDRSNQGSLAALEVGQVLKNIGETIAENDIDSLLQELDSGGTGQIKIATLVDYLTA